MLPPTVLIDHAGEMKSLIGLDACCLDRRYDQYYLIRDDDSWSRKLDFECRHRHGPARHLLVWHNREVAASFQWNLGLYYASTRVIGRIAKVEISVLFFGSFFPAGRFGHVEQR